MVNDSRRIYHVTLPSFRNFAVYFFILKPELSVILLEDHSGQLIVITSEVTTDGNGEY